MTMAKLIEYYLLIGIWIVEPMKVLKKSNDQKIKIKQFCIVTDEVLFKWILNLSFT